MRKRDRIHKQARRSQSIADREKFKRQRNHVNNLKKYAKQQFYLNANNLLDELSTSSSKSYWSLIKRFTKPSNNFALISQLTNENDTLVEDDYEKACVLNKYFSSVSTLDNTNATLPTFPSRTNSILDTFQITPNQVRDILQILKLGKASGPDYISHHMLKNTCDTVCLPLALFFNMSLAKAEYPNQ